VSTNEQGAEKRASRYPRIGRAPSFDYNLPGVDKESEITAIIDVDEDPRPTEKTATALSEVEASLSVLEDAVKIDRQRGDDALVALRRSFDADMKKASAVIAECETLAEQFCPIKERVVAFLESTVWARLAAAAQSGTRQRVDRLAHLAEEARFCLSPGDATDVEELPGSHS
jgi:hypothetical protein